MSTYIADFEATSTEGYDAEFDAVSPSPNVAEFEATTALRTDVYSKTESDARFQPIGEITDLTPYQTKTDTLLTDTSKDIVTAINRNASNILDKLKVSDIVAGDNITLDKVGNEVTINGSDLTPYQKITDPTLPTTNKTITGAFTEIKATADEGVSFENKYADTIARWLNVFPASYNASVDVVNETFTVIGETVTLAEAVKTLSFYQSYPALQWKFSMQLGGSYPKLLIPCLTALTSNSLENSLRYNKQTDIFYLDADMVYPWSNSGCVDMDTSFYNSSVKKILGKFKVLQNNSTSLPYGLTYLDVIYTTDAYFENFNQVTFDNLQLLLNQSGNGDTIVTWTLHADIYAKIADPNNADYAEWSQLATLATSKNINIATV